MVRDGLAKRGEFWIVEHDEHGRVVGEPFPRRAGSSKAKKSPV